ncbi:protein PELOTA 1-like [Capsicum galapagoense]
MKFSGEKLIPHKPGTITIIPEKPRDIWLLFNLIVNGDIIFSSTTRKIQNSPDSSRMKNNSRIKLELEIRILSMEYEKDCSILRVRGKTIKSNEHVKSGVFQTLELEIKKKFNLTKKIWDEETIRVLKDEPAQKKESEHDFGSRKRVELNMNLLEKFMNMVATNSDRACYGTQSVEYAHELMAIDTLLITEKVFENNDFKVRKKYCALKKSVIEAGGKVLQFNDVEGDKLARMTGVAAILRFPIPNLDDLVL